LASPDVQAIVFLFLVAFPLSICLWAVILIGGGGVRSVAAMPPEFRLAASATGADSGQGPSGPAVPVTLFFLVVCNIVPVGLLVRPYGPISWVAAVVYVVVQSLWLVRIRRAVQRINRQ